jgi:hypothetical protein
VVQPRLRPGALLNSKLAEALNLASSLEEARDNFHKAASSPGDKGGCSPSLPKTVGRPLARAVLAGALRSPAYRVHHGLQELPAWELEAEVNLSRIGPIRGRRWSIRPESPRIDRFWGRWRPTKARAVQVQHGAGAPTVRHGTGEIELERQGVARR